MNNFSLECSKRNPDRIEHVLEKVRELWKKYPDQRFLQLMSFVNYRFRDEFGIDCYYSEDDKVMEFIDRLIKEEV